MKTLRKILLLTVLLGLVCVQARAQRGRDVMFTHFMDNTQAFNPAYVGGREAMTITSLNRSQWTLLFDKPPAFSSLSIQSPTSKTPLGLGLTVQNERVGPEKIMTVEGDVAYTVKTSRKSTLSFGIKAGLSVFNVPLTELIIDDPSDPLFAADIQSHWLPNFGFGMLFRSEKFYMGASIPKMLRTNPFTNRLYAGAKPALTERIIYVVAGAAIPLNIDIDFLPSGIVRYQPGGELLTGVSTNFVFFDKFTAGLTYRHDDSFGVLAGIKITNLWLVSYSFDWGIKNRVRYYNSGTHELVLRYDLVFLPSHKERTKRPF